MSFSFEDFDTNNPLFFIDRDSIKENYIYTDSLPIDIFPENEDGPTKPCSDNNIESEKLKSREGVIFNCGLDDDNKYTLKLWNKNNINNNENINNINIVNNNNFIGENENQNQTDYLINNDKIKFLNQSYDIYAFGVFIHNNKLIVQVRFVDLNNDKININTTPKLTNKKRNRNKNENSNLKTCPTTNSPFRKKRRGHTQVNSNVKNKKLVMNCWLI